MSKGTRSFTFTLILALFVGLLAACGGGAQQPTSPPAAPGGQTPTVGAQPASTQAATAGPAGTEAGTGAVTAGPEGTAEATTGPEGTSEATAGVEATEPAQSGTGGKGKPVAVKLVDFKLEMPKTVPSGMVTFKITNTGKVTHNLEIEGNGVESKLPKDLQPGESGTLQVTLKPGKYDAYCPVDGHKQSGMQLDLTVTK